VPSGRGVGREDGGAGGGEGVGLPAPALRVGLGAELGALVSVTSDSVLLRTVRSRDTSLVSLSRAAVRYLDVAIDSGTYAWRGAGIGAAIAAVAGAAYILAQDCEGSELCESLTPAVAVGAAGAGVLWGGVIGGIIGSMVTRVQWVRVPLPMTVGLLATPPPRWELRSPVSSFPLDGGRPCLKLRSTCAAATLEWTATSRPTAHRRTK